MNKRTRLVLGIIVGAVIIFSGTLFGLAKYGVIDIKTLADTVVKSTKQTVNPKAETSSARITLTLPEVIPTGATIVIKNTTTGNTYSQVVTDPGDNVFTGNYTFTNIAPGHYEGDESKCVRVYPFNVSADDAGGHSTGEILAGCSEIGLLCGQDYCHTGEHCVEQNGTDGEPPTYSCHTNCTSTSCPSNQICDIYSRECVTPTLREVNLQMAIKTNCTEATCTNRNSIGLIDKIPVSFDKFSGQTMNAQGSFTNITFLRVMTGNYTFKINDPSAVGHNPAYESKTVEQTVYKPDTEFYARIDINLEKKNTNVLVFDPNKFSLLGKVTDKNGNPIAGVEVAVKCLDSDQTTGNSCGQNNTWTATSSADYLSYYPGLPADKKFNYEVKNIDKFATNTTFPALRVEFTKDGNFWDRNEDGIDNDSSDIDFIPKPSTSYTVANNPPAQLYVGWKNALIAERKYFTITGQVFKSLGKPTLAENVKISITKDENFDEILGTVVSKDTKYWPTNATTGSQIGNYAVENIPWNYEATYKISVESLSPSYDFMESTDLEFSGDEVSFNSTYNANLIIFHSLMMTPINLTQVIHFKDAVTGQGIELSKEKITENKLSCQDTSSEINCVEGEPQISGDTIRYKIIDGTSISLISLKFETEKYMGFLEEHFLTMGEATVYLVPRIADLPSDISSEEAMGLIDVFSGCRMINTVKFCTFKANEISLFTPEKMVTLASYSKIIRAMSKLAGVKMPPFIFMWPAGYESLVRGFTLSNPNMPIFLSESALKENIAIDSVSVLIHEFGHYVYYSADVFDTDTLIKINNAATVFKNNNKSCVQALTPKYTCFSYYGASQSNEFFAEFYQWWIQNIDEIESLIGDTALDNPDLSSCKKVIMLMDQILQEKLPNMKRFRKVSQQSLSDKGKVAGVDTNTDESVSYFLNLMSSFGFEASTGHTYSIIAPISIIPLTQEQVSSGTWLQSNYNALPLADKVALQINIAQTRASNLIVSATTNIATQLANINQSIENLMIRLGIKITNTKVAGIVRDQGGPVEGIAVTFSNKMAVTDREGKYSINRTKAGSNLKINLSDPKIKKNYASNPKTLTIGENQQLSNINLSFSRPSYQLKGKVYQGNAPLVKGQLIIDGTRTVTLNAKGEFNFKLKEGQHKIIIRNSRGKTLTVANPGKFDNLVKFKNTQNIDSLIWVR